MIWDIRFQADEDDEDDCADFSSPSPSRGSHFFLSLPGGKSSLIDGADAAFALRGGGY